MQTEPTHSAPSQAYRGAIGATVRRMNLLAVLRALRHGEPVSSSELRDLMDVNASTIVRLMRALTSAGLVDEDGHERSQSAGRRAKLWRLNARAGYVIGVSYAMRKVRSVAVDLSGRPVKFAEVPARGRLSTAGLPEAVRSAVAAVLREVSPEAQILGVGVATCGVVDPAQGVLHASAGLLTDGGESAHGYPLLAELARVLSWPVSVGNDAKLGALAAFAEGRRAGWVGNDGSLVYLMGGDDPAVGYSAGLVLGGRLYAGCCGAAGEALRVPANIEPRLVPAELMRRAERGGRSAALAVTRLLSPVLEYLVSMALSMDADAIVLGGSFAALGTPILAAATDLVAQAYSRDYFADLHRPVVRLDEAWPHTVELGAAGLVLDSVYGPPEPSDDSPLVRVALGKQRTAVTAVQPGGDGTGSRSVWDRSN